MNFPAKFKVIVKPSSSKEGIAYDEAKNAYIVTVKAPAEKNKANKELLKLLRKETGRQATIVSGLTSHEKIIRLE